MAQSRAQLRRNFFDFLLDAIYFVTGIRFISDFAVIPGFVSQLTSSQVVIGLSSSLFPIFWTLPQLIGAAYIARSKNPRNWMAHPAIFTRATLGLIAIAIIGLGPDHREAILLIFLVCYAIFASGDGIVALAWVQVMAPTLTPQLRARFMGIAQTLTGIMTFAAIGPFTGLIIDNLEFGINYGILFLLAFLSMMLSVTAIISIRPVHTEPAKDLPTLREYVPFLRDILKTDTQYRIYLRTRLLLDASNMALPFYIGLAVDQFGISVGSAVAQSSAMFVIGNALGGLMWGYISSAVGGRRVLRGMTLLAAAHPFVVLLSAVMGSPLIWSLAYVANGLIQAGMSTGSLAWMMDHSPSSRQSIYMGLNGAFITVIYLTMPGLGGLLLQTTSYPVLFTVAGFIGVFSFISALRLYEPRIQSTHQVAGRIP